MLTNMIRPLPMSSVQPYKAFDKSPRKNKTIAIGFLVLVVYIRFRINLDVIFFVPEKYNIICPQTKMVTCWVSRTMMGPGC